MEVKKKEQKEEEGKEQKGTIPVRFSTRFPPTPRAPHILPNLPLPSLPSRSPLPPPSHGDSPITRPPSRPSNCGTKTLLFHLPGEPIGCSRVCAWRVIGTGTLDPDLLVRFIGEDPRMAGNS